jgi:hypothetical protein
MDSKQGKPLGQSNLPFISQPSAYGNFNKERMEAALASEKWQVPNHLKKQELIQFILSKV